MQLKTDDNGMTLLELIISIAISVIVVLMIITLISSAFRVFRRTSDSVNLQMEAQTAINQITNLALEAESISDEITVGNTVRYRVNNIDLAGTDTVIILDQDTNKLYLAEIDPASSVDTVTYTEQENLLAEYVTEFRITEISTDAKVSIKQISMKLELGKDTYEISKNVNLRNFK